MANGASSNIVRNNYIGTDKTGTVDLGQTMDGVLIDNRTGNTVRDNLISGNNGNGILIRNNAAGGTANIIRENLIGTQADGTTGLPNTGHGIFDQNGALSSLAVGGNTIGGILAGEPNTIAFNGGAGVAVAVVTAGSTIAGTEIRGNSIHSNSGLGIDLGANAVTPNDVASGDPDRRQTACKISR